MPAVALSQFINRIRRSSKVAFLCAIVAGFVTHLFIMTNKVMNHNELSNLFLDTHEMTMGRMAEGRWFVGWIGQLIGDNYSMQMVVGVLGILLIACAAGMVVSLLDISKPLYAGLLGASMTVFPALVSFLAFTQLGDAWFMAVFMAVLAVYLTENQKWGIWPAMVLAGLSLAIHQAYISVTIAGMFVVLFRTVYEKGMGFKDNLPRIGKYLAVLMGGFLFYYIGVKVTAAIFSYDLSSYYGINEMTEFTVKGICKGIVYAYLYFVRYFFTTEYLFHPLMVIVDILLAVVLVYYVIASVIRSFRAKKRMNAVWKVLLLLLLPVGMNALPVLMADRVGAGVDRYMMYSLVFLWVLLLYLADRMEVGVQEKVPGRKLCLWMITLGICIHVGNDYTMDNQAYYRAQATTEQMTNYLNRLAARIEATEDWSADVPVYIVMQSDLYPQYPVDLAAFDDLAELRGTSYEPHMNVPGIIRFMNYYLHFPVRQAEDTQIDRIDKRVIDAMPCYPAAGSVRMVDGILVVKIEERAD